MAAPATVAASMSTIIAASTMICVSAPIAPKSRKAKSASGLHGDISVHRCRIDVNGLRAGVNRLRGDVDRHIRRLVKRNTETDVTSRIGTASKHC